MAIRAVKRVALHTMVFLGACGGGDGGRTDAEGVVPALITAAG